MLLQVKTQIPFQTCRRLYFAHRLRFLSPLLKKFMKTWVWHWNVYGLKTSASRQLATPYRLSFIAHTEQGVRVSLPTEGADTWCEQNTSGDNKNCKSDKRWLSGSKTHAPAVVGKLSVVVVSKTVCFPWSVAFECVTACDWQRTKSDNSIVVLLFVVICFIFSPHGVYLRSLGTDWVLQGHHAGER